MVKNQLKSVFSFTRKEMNGLLIFCFLLLLIIVAPVIYRWLKPVEAFSFSQFKSEIARFRASEKVQHNSYKPLKTEIEEKELSPQYFEFDPNGLSFRSWQKLGLSGKQIRVIKNYEAKGGRFYAKEDLQKIYSVSPDDYARLEPYIRIPQTSFKSEKPAHTFNKFERTAIPAIMVELNSADSAMLETVNGIGPVFASRIIRYRDRLGGFYKKEQLKEVFGMDSLKYEQLQSQVKADAAAIQKININTAAFDDIKKHPYLSYKQMNAIIQYRKQHGVFTSAEDLKKIAILNEEILHKIGPYLTFGN